MKNFGENQKNTERCAEGRAEKTKSTEKTKSAEKFKILKALPLGALFFALSSIIVKGIGALYKIPLAALLGAEGTGLYQMIFPLYALILIFSASSVPAALTRIIVCGYNEKEAVKKSFVLFTGAGVFFGVLLYVFADKIAAVQGNADAASLYRIVSPAIAICSAISVLRGALQGKGTYFHTAVSQIIEQCVKAAFGLLCLSLFGGNVIEKAETATAAVVFSEIVALFYMAFVFVRRVRSDKIVSEKEQKQTPNETMNKSPNEKQSGKGKVFKYKTLLFYVAPLCLTGLVMPLSAFSDSFIAINALNKNFGDATALYGAFAGGSEAVTALPVGAITAFASACLPELAKSVSSRKKLFAFSAIASALAAIAVFLFSSGIVDLIFSRFGDYKPLVSALLKASAVNIVFQSLLAVSNVILLATDKQTYSVFSMFTGLLIKIALSLLLVKNPQINLFGLIISDSCFYFVALGLNLGYIISCGDKNAFARGFLRAERDVASGKK